MLAGVSLSFCHVGLGFEFVSSGLVGGRHLDLLRWLAGRPMNTVQSFLSHYFSNPDFLLNLSSSGCSIKYVAMEFRLSSSGWLVVLPCPC